MPNYTKPAVQAEPNPQAPQRRQSRSGTTVPVSRFLSEDYRNLLLQAPALIAVMHGPDHILDLMNPLALQLFGNRDVIGKPLHKAFPELKEHGYFDIVDKVFTTGQPVYGNEQPAMIDRHNDGKPELAYFNFVFHPLRTDAGMYGVMVHAIEVTETVRARQIAQRSEERLRVAQKAGNIGTFEWLVKENTVYWTPELAELYGLPAEELHADLSLFEQLVHPDDRERVREQMTNFVVNKKVDPLEFRIITADGNEKWLTGQGEAFLDEHGEIERIIGINFDITERKKIENEKDDFIGIASHELKTPVTSIRVLNQMLRSPEHNKDATRQKDLLEKMDRQITKLSQLITDLLDVTKIQSGRMTIRKEEFRLDKLVEEVVEDMQHTTTHTIGLKTRCKHNVFADRERTAQVLVNLISNAIKYSPGANRIEVDCTCNATSAIVTVTDFGIGMTKKEIQRIFERFYRGEGHGREGVQGLGLGLFISSEIIKMQGGSIEVSSSLGKGSEIKLVLPLQIEEDNNKTASKSVKKRVTIKKVSRKRK